MNQPLTIKYRLGGMEAGGKGGKDCGTYNIKDGHNGAGSAIITNLKELLIVAGGGGGDSENDENRKTLNKGGNCGKDGWGKLGGKGGEKYKGGGNWEEKKEDWVIFKGKDGASSRFPNKFCGGGGGDGAYGGEAGGVGNKGENGGGGGGSNYCNKDVVDYCYDDEAGINDKDYSGIKIFRYMN